MTEWFDFSFHNGGKKDSLCNEENAPSCTCQYMNIWCNLIFRIDRGLQGGDEGKHLCFYCSFYKPPRTGLLSCYCSGSKFTSFHYVRHNDITCLEIYCQALKLCQSTVSWLTILIQARSVSSLTLTSVSCDKVNYFGVRQRVWLRNEMWE